LNQLLSYVWTHPEILRLLGVLVTVVPFAPHAGPRSLLTPKTIIETLATVLLCNDEYEAAIIASDAVDGLGDAIRPAKAMSVIARVRSMLPVMEERDQPVLRLPPVLESLFSELRESSAGQSVTNGVWVRRDVLAKLLGYSESALNNWMTEDGFEDGMDEVIDRIEVPDANSKRGHPKCLYRLGPHWRKFRAMEKTDRFEKDADSIAD
jgi:hypothetical protein